MSTLGGAILIALIVYLVGLVIGYFIWGGDTNN
jgi:hypothetical protein